MLKAGFVWSTSIMYSNSMGAVLLKLKLRVRLENIQVIIRIRIRIRHGESSMVKCVCLPFSNGQVRKLVIGRKVK